MNKTEKFSPIAILLIVASCCMGVQKNTLIQAEYFDLFLNTPDYYAAVFAEPWPITHIISSFLSQFLDIEGAGALVVGGLVVAIYAGVSFFLRRCRVPVHQLCGIIVASACWAIFARGFSLLGLTACAEASALLAFCALFLKNVPPRKIQRWESALAAVVIMGAYISIIGSKEVRKEEKLAQVRVDTRRQEWGKLVLDVSPKDAENDRRLMPYVFLAQSVANTLGSQMFQYPIQGPEDFDTQGDNSLNGELFSSFLADNLGCTNEAIHHIFQFSCHMPHGMCHLTLYQLIRYNIEAQNFTMVRKYAEILSHSPKNKKRMLQILEMYADAVDAPYTERAPEGLPVGADARVISDNPAMNMGNMRLDGLNTQAAVDRFLAYMLLYGHLEGFAETVMSIEWPNGVIPKHWQEALLVAGVSPDFKGIPDVKRMTFEQFNIAASSGDPDRIERVGKDSYWLYYYKSVTAGE